MRKTLFIVSVTLLLGACTDANWSRVTAIGSSGEISCYSGGNLIYHGISTGKISAEEHSDGWFLKDAKTGKLVRVSGDCVIVN